MLYVKLFDGSGECVGMEMIQKPVYVRQDRKAGMPLRCPKYQAQGVVSADGTQIYCFESDGHLKRAVLRAVKITMMEYREQAVDCLT